MHCSKTPLLPITPARAGSIANAARPERMLATMAFAHATAYSILNIHVVKMLIDNICSPFKVSAGS
jgi:hypothetical protein